MGGGSNFLVVWTFFSTAFLGNWDEDWPRIDFQSCGHCWVFQIWWHIECSTLIASSFRILNRSTGIPSPPLALLTAALPKAHLTSHYRMSGYGLVTTPSWLSWVIRPFLYSAFAYYFHLFLISSASIRSLLFLSFIVPIFGWNILLIFLIFLNRSLVFPFLLFSSIYLHCSLKQAFLFLLAILWNSGFRLVCLSLSPLLFTSLLASAVCKASQITTWLSCFSFSLGWICSLPPV